MEINKKISELKKSIDQTNELLDKLLLKFNDHNLLIASKDKKISHLKSEISDNVEKINKIIEEYNANL